MLRTWFRLVAPLSLAVQAYAQGGLPSGERIDTAVNARIREEGFQRSRVVETATLLSDVYGPRLAGSPEFKTAARWALGQMTTFGLSNARMESWGAVHGASWTATSYSIELTAPRYARLVGYPKAWSPSTAGTITGTPIIVDIRADTDLVRYRGKLKGAIVMNGRTRPDTNRFAPRGRRFTDQELDSMSRRVDPGDPRTYWDDAEGFPIGMARRRALAAAIRREGVAVLLEPSRNPDATVVAQYVAYDNDASNTVPSMVVARADYDRIQHLVESNQPVRLAISIQSRATRGDSLGYNIVAEIPGTDPTLQSQIVMVGGHFDSWNAGTGATDNAAGCAVALEAMRILKAIGARPRRTIRVALWDGEEQEDYFGSMGYVKKHFGDPETMTLKPEHGTISAYFNFDNGTGRVRGIYLQGNSAVRPVLDAFLSPFADLGAAHTTIANTGSTDHMPFTAVGIPAFTFIQDPIDYETRTHHSSLDVASNLLAGDLMQAAVVTASVIYHTANRDQLLPRPSLPLPHKKP